MGKHLGKGLSPNLSLLLSEYYSYFAKFVPYSISDFDSPYGEGSIYANGKRIRDIEKLLCESADVGFLTSYCNSIKAVPDTVLSMVGGKRGIDSIQHKKLIELKRWLHCFLNILRTVPSEEVQGA